MGDTNIFFEAKTFAVIGASRDDKKVGHAIFKNLLASNKKVFPVNPKTKNLLGQKCYQDIFEIPHQIDCIVVAIPARLVPLILRQAQKKKVRSVIILSAGFSETGSHGLQEKIKAIAEEANITLLGPNSYGFIDPSQKLNTTYFEGIPEQGETAFISQSGAIGSAILDKNEKLSGFISTGNSAQLDFSDFIEYYAKDPKTKVITIYMEALTKSKGRKFIDTCKKCKKPIVVLKAGKSQAGQEAAMSHTAALASEAGVYEGILKQAGTIQVDSIKQLFDVAKILEKFSKLGNKATIITNAGGLGVLTTDACEKNKIQLPKLKKSAKAKLDKILPSAWSHHNPIDLVGDALAEDYEKALQIIEKEKTDFTIVLLTPQRMTESLKTAKALAKAKKPIFACFLGKEQIKESKYFMDKHGITNFDDITEMCETIGKIID